LNALFIDEDALKLKGITFLVSANQMLYDSFLEDINNLLNSGEIPNLYQTEELDELHTKVKELASKKDKNLKLQSKEQIWNYFIGLVRE